MYLVLAALGLVSVFLGFKLQQERREHKRVRDVWVTHAACLRKAFEELFYRNVLAPALNAKLSDLANEVQKNHEQVVTLQRQLPEKKKLSIAVELNEELENIQLQTYQVELGPRKYEAYVTT